MGTSKGYRGPPNGLVPTWLGGVNSDGDGEDAGGDAGVGDGTGETNASDGGDVNDVGSGGEDRQGQPAGGAAAAGGFTSARTSFTRFSKTGSSSSLGAALASYVGGGGGGGRGSNRSGGGARRSAQRMGSSLASGGRLLGVVRDFRAVGPDETLRRLDLQGMADRPASEVFLAMLEFLCPPGGAIDEAISRQAMLEAIGNLDRDVPIPFEELAPAQLSELFLDFVALSIEGRVIADIGARGIELAPEVAAIERTHEQLHDFIQGCCRVHLSGLLTGLEALNGREVEQRSNEIYEAAFGLISEAGEEAR